MMRKGSVTPLGHYKAPSTPALEVQKVYEPFQDTKLVVPVRIKSYDREERVVPLTIDISFRSVNSSHHQTLLIEVTEETDPCFLYVVEFGETEFHAVREEQGILVDFPTFPHNVAELLRACENSSSYYAVINRTQAETTINVVEVNNFKQLTHVSLRMRQGQNETLLRHLSKNLTRMKEEGQAMGERIRELETALEEVSSHRKELKEHCTRLAAEKEKSENEATVRLAVTVRETQDRMRAEKEAEMQKLKDEKVRVENKLESEVADLKAKFEDLKAKNEQLAATKAGLEQKCSDLTRTVEHMQHELDVAASQLDPLRASNLKYASSQSFQERHITELTLRSQNFEQQLKDKEGIIDKLNELTVTLNEQKAQREEEIAILRASKQKLEDKISQSVQEILKGNQIIEKLQSARKAKREKLKLKSAVLMQQEEVINKKQAQLDESEREKYTLQREIALRDDRVREAEKHCDDLKRQVEDAHRLLEESKHQISYLNKEMTKTRTITSTFPAPASKPPTPGPYGSTFKPSGYNIEALRATPTRSQLSPSGSSSVISDIDSAPRAKDPVKYREPVG